MMYLRGQIYFISVFIVGSIIFYSSYLITSTNESIQTTYMLYDFLKQVIYANTTFSCEDIRYIIDKTYGNTQFSYIIFDSNKINKCDPYNITDKILTKDFGYIVKIRDNEKIRINYNEKYTGIIIINTGKINYIKKISIINN